MEPRATKLCSRCQQTKSVDAFSIRGRGGYQAWCKTCMTAWGREKRREKWGLPIDAPLMRGRREGLPIGSRRRHRGYIHVRTAGHHRADRYGWVFEHIVVAEAKYGIQITRGFTVHHINGDRSDNRPENLELRVGPHGKGATLIPALLRDPEARAAARLVLAQYPDDQPGLPPSAHLEATG